MTKTYDVWLKGQVGFISVTGGCFRGTRKQAKTMLRFIERDTPDLKGKMVVATQTGLPPAKEIKQEAQV